MKTHTLTIVGVGLIGGSVALGAKKRGLADRVVGIDNQRESIDRALALGAIDVGFQCEAPAESFGEIIVVCTPVDQIVAQVALAAHHSRAGAVLTDSGSVKGTIVREVERLTPKIAFVGSHPLAGSEKQGVEHASPDLFQDRLTIVTRSPQTDAGALERISSFWQALGSRVQSMSPEAHDRAVARTSHVPHLLASALSAYLEPELQPLAATGFKDVTRIASGDPALWSAILMHNRPAIRDGLRELESCIQRFRRALDEGNGDALTDVLALGKRRRDDLGS
jgi:prephenate dehydrogenase